MSSIEIRVGNEPTTTITNRFTVKPDDQDELIRIEVDGMSRIASRLPGFVCGSIHRSLDGSSVVNYVHWADGDAWRRAHELGAQDPEYRKHMEAVRRIATAEPRSYEVVAVVDGDAT
ncbi:antibiotic biosynthesis monooxygenase family protein [Streptomyces sp. NPDC059340]|uniref:antibiotic biosynthesis monooxygenase family protein n=1 Tax=Streptomyces sp. NPDC059340 TaxID=3346806 RepID=UPI0036C69B7B